MSRVTEKGEETRARIVQVATQAFAEHGYAGSSMADLIRRAEITKGGFYFHFASKEELALAVAAEADARSRLGLTALLESDAPAIELLETLGRAAVAKQSSDNTDQRAAERICRELAEVPEIAAHLVPPNEYWTEIVAQLVRRAQTEGDVPPEVDADVAGRLVIAMYFGLCEMFDERPGAMAAYEDAYMEFVMRGIQARR